jgi:hypothetical protein
MENTVSLLLTGPLPSNSHRIVERVCCGNVFTDPLPSNGYTRRNIYRVQIMKLLIMQFSSSSCYFIPLVSKYFSQHPVLTQLLTFLTLSIVHFFYLKTTYRRPDFASVTFRSYLQVSYITTKCNRV